MKQNSPHKKMQDFKMQDFLDSYFYKPNFFQKILAFALLPISFVYLCVATCKRKFWRLWVLAFGGENLSLGVFAKFFGTKNFGVPIISVGNIIAGGSGKTPFIIYLARFLLAKYSVKICIISRGYSRSSKGLVWVAKDGQICASVQEAGDEPYLIAKSLTTQQNLQQNTKKDTQKCLQKISLIVCENREKAITEAIKNQVKIILLDDAFRFCFDKFDIILRPSKEPYFGFCLPSGLYRESIRVYDTYTRKNDVQKNCPQKNAGQKNMSKNITQKNLAQKHCPLGIILKEGVDFVRKVRVDNPSSKMLLLTAIANPSRLESFLQDYSQNILGKITLKDHATFEKDACEKWLKSSGATSILTTQKDEVKLESFGLPLSIMRLDLEVKIEVLEPIINYIDTTLGTILDTNPKLDTDLEIDLDAK